MNNQDNQIPLIETYCKFWDNFNIELYLKIKNRYSYWHNFNTDLYIKVIEAKMKNEITQKDLK